MNGEVDCEKVVQREFKGVSYIVTLKADSQGLSIQFQNKFTGDIWESYYQPEHFEQITTKAGSHKKYNKFVQMLSKALPQNFAGDGYQLFIDLLTHHDLQMQANRKNGNTSKTTDPRLINKRYLILSYVSTYDKAHYPIPLDFVTSPDPERLKLTIRRLAQEISYCQSNPKTDAIMKQLSAMKHENQLLKSKLRSMNKFESKQNQNNNTINKQMEEQNKNLKQELSSLKQNRQDQLNKKSKIIQDKDKKILQLQTKIKKQQKNNGQYELYQQKFNSLSKQANQIAAALQHSKQNQKKSQLKITNLQKQLQKIMGQLKNKSTSTHNIINSPRKSDNGSVRSTSSINKKTGLNNSKKKNIPQRKNSGVYDSDTQSSRMRKNNNGRVSPYRQPTRPLNSSNSAKKKQKQTQRVNAISKYSNISNLYNKDRSRSRSKSRSVRRQQSPPSDNFESSAIMTEGVEYPSDNQEDNKVSQTIARLRNHRNKKLNQQKNKVKQKKTSLNPIQQKISSIASLMRTFRNNNNANVEV